jgi:hypothetical protein
MNVEEVIINYLSADVTLQGLVGAAAGDTKIYPEYGPHKKSYPCVLWHVVDDSTAEENLQEIIVQFDCAAESFYAALNIKRRIEYLLNLQDKIRSALVDANYFFYWCKQISSGRYYESDEGTMRVVGDFRFKYGNFAAVIVQTNLFPTDSVNKIMSFTFQGTLIDEKTIRGVYFPSAVTITKIGLHIEDAPAGAAVTVDILKGGVEQARIATLAAGAVDQETGLAVISFSSIEEFGIKIKSVGTIDPGAGLTVQVFYA